jgi:uncharacterized protein (TIGR03000 family)
MRKLMTVAALTATLALLTADAARAGGRRGGCSGGSCGVATSGGCAGGNCGGTVALSGGCPGGVCAVKGGGAMALADARPANLLVTLPADATLTIDGHKTVSTSAQRMFTTPALEVGKEFTYTLKAEVVRDGKTEVATKVVTVRGGEQTTVKLDIPVQTASN